jgi:hypothetical protein
MTLWRLRVVRVIALARFALMRFALRLHVEVRATPERETASEAG